MGCLAQLLPMLIFISFNKVLGTTFELYKAPFILWLSDLSAPDPFSILPIIVGLGTFYRMSNVVDAKQLLIMALLSLFLTGVFINLASGVVLLLGTNVIVDIIQAYAAKRFSQA
jgi:YidC/Oxa1 family membrane protein insertase